MSDVSVRRTSHKSMDAWCRQAFSLISKGKIAEARKLAGALALDFPWLWSKEEDFQENRICQEISSLRDFLLEGVSPSLYRNDLKNRFLALSSLPQNLRSHSRLASRQWSLVPNANFEDPPRQIPDSSSYFGIEQQCSDFLYEEDCEFNPAWKRVESGSIHAILTFEGEETGLGAFYADGVEIRSFGPQALPLSCSGGFGIRSVHKENKQWISSFALPEVWMHVDAKPMDSGTLLLEFSFFGLDSKSPLALAFYVKAKTARAKNHSIAPRSLQRYVGENLPVVFEEHLELKASWEGKMYLLPLAGVGGFWGCEYLTAFEIPPCCSKGNIVVALIQ